MLRTSHRLFFKIIDVTVKMAIRCVEANYLLTLILYDMSFFFICRCASKQWKHTNRKEPSSHQELEE